MWTVTGAFEGAVAGETNFEKVKLVKPGKEYVVGRKDCALLINDRKVSRKHQVFVVGKHTAQDVENPNVIPTLELHNLSINRWVERDGQKLPVNAGAVMSLQGGDKVDVLHNVVISVQWQEIVCYCPPSKESIMPSMEECAKLGLKVVWKLHPSVTHHVTPELSLDPAVATSLLSLTKFVTPDWLQTILKRGSSSDPSLSLEHEFTLPSLSQFRPALSPNLPPSLQSYRSWEPNEARVDLFKPFRFIFVGERGREVAEEYVELVRRGGAGYSCCAVQGGRKALHSALAKGKEMEQELVLVANVAAMVAAVGQDEWDELVKEAAQYELVFISHAKLIEAVAHIDLSHVNCRLTHKPEATSSSTPPNAQLSESKQESDIPPPPPRRKLVRRAGSSAPPSMPPPDVPASSSITPATPAGTMDSQAPAPPRRRLVRRAGVAKPTIVGVDDPSIIEEAPPVINPGASSSAEPLPPATQSRPNRLKRRAGVTQPQESQLFAAIDASLAVVEPPHKKYKALFEESDPDRVTQSGASITQPETPSDQPGASSHSAPLPVVTEEEEESINPSGAVSQQVGTLERSQGTKRPRTDVDDDVDMEDVERPAKRPNPDTGISESHTASTGSQAAPRSASVKPFSSTQINIDKTSKAGAASGKPDRDEAFLKAVASTKKGKKHEDDFDREFNDLRISKPDLEQEKVREDWGILDDFGDDSNLRGNFMVVVEMDVFRKENSARNAMRVAGGRADWEGRPDFKKFKKKATGERRKPVELVVEDDESGMSQDTWRGALSQPKTQSQAVRTERHQTESPRKKTGLIVDSDDDLPAAKPASKKPASSQSQRKPEPRARATQKSRASQKKANPLFLDSEEEGEDVAEEDSAPPPGGEENINDSDSEGTLTTTGRRTQPARSTAKKRSAPALIIDDDSDDGATFQGFGRKKTRR